MSIQLRLLYAAVGALLLTYGMKVIVAGEIVAEGSRWRGAGWALHGNLAMGIGAVLAVVGIYILYQVINKK